MERKLYTKAINGYAGYTIDDNGVIKQGKQVLAPIPDGEGRLWVRLYDASGNPTQRFVRELYAEAFPKAEAKAFTVPSSGTGAAAATPEGKQGEGESDSDPGQPDADTKGKRGK